MSAIYHFIDMLKGISAKTEFNNISVYVAGSFTPCHVQYCSFRSSGCQKQINSTLNLYTLVYWLTKANKQKPIIKSRASIIAKSESE